MAPPRRRSSQSSQGSEGPPPPKHGVESDIPSADPNAIDHNLDLVPSNPQHPPPPPDQHTAALMDSFDLFLDDELNVEHEMAAAEPPAPKEEEEDERKPAAAKKKTKAKQRGSAQESAVPKDPPPKKSSMDIEEIKKTYGTARLERIRRQYIRDAWREYNEEKDRVIMQLPEEIVNKFGQMGFGKFGKKWFPVLIVSPFDVALQNVRDDWYTSFEKALEGKIRFAHCGYWIGETNYSPLAQTQFVTFDEATPIQTRLLSAAIRKVEKGATIKPNSEDAYMHRASLEIERLKELTPEERRRQVPHTRHPFEDSTIDEILKDMDEKGVTVEIFERDMSEDEGPDDGVDDDGVVAHQTKMQAPSPCDRSEENKRAASIATLPKKAKRKKRRKEQKHNQHEDAWLDIQEASPTEPLEPKDPAPALGTKDETNKSESSDDEEENDEEDLPSDDDKDDDDFDLDETEEPVNPVVDEDLVGPLAPSSSKGRKRKTAPSGKKETPKKQMKRAESTTTLRKEKKPDIPVEEKTDKQKRDWITRKFKKNEEKIVPLLERLHAVNEDTASDRIDKLLSELDEQIEQMCWVFIEKHTVPSALKPAKKVLKGRGEDFSRVLVLKGKMRTRYDYNKRLFPKFEPKTLREATYLPKADTQKGDSKSVKSVGEESEKQSFGTKKKSEDKGRQREAISNADNSVQRRSSVDPHSDKIRKKRELTESMSQSDRGIRKRDSTGSLTQLDRPHKKKGALTAGASREDSAAPRSRPETPMERVASNQSLQQSKSVLGAKASIVHEEKAGDIPRKRDSGSTHVKRELSQASAETGRKSPAKPRPKSFSLGSFMSSSTQEKSSSQTKPPAVKESVKAEKPLPAWMCSEAARTPEVRSRLYGLEFFREMAQCFPADKVNREAMAVTLEAETYRWAVTAMNETPLKKSNAGAKQTSEKEIMKKYWKKVRTIVAVVCGKHRPGILMREILKGDFESARDLVEMSEDKFSAYATRDLSFC